MTQGKHVSILDFDQSYHMFYIKTDIKLIKYILYNNTFGPFCNGPEHFKMEHRHHSSLRTRISPACNTL